MVNSSLMSSLFRVESLRILVLFVVEEHEIAHRHLDSFAPLVEVVQGFIDAILVPLLHPSVLHDFDVSSASQTC